MPDEPIGRIRPGLYGHFTEHIGGVVYDGIWVGEDSKIPNSAHRDGTSLRTAFECPDLVLGSPQRPGRLWGLGGSASLHDRRLVLTAVNPSVAEARDTEIVVRAARIESARASVLSGDEIQAHNSFDLPNAVTPRRDEAAPSGGRLVYSFPPASVVRLVCELTPVVNRICRDLGIPRPGE